MKKFIIFLFPFFLLTTSSCSSAPTSSPAIRFNNSSPSGEIIKKINVTWNGAKLLSRTGDFTNCGGGGHQSFNIYQESDFFGPVHVEWENASGKKLTKDFIFKKEDLPSYKYRHQAHVYSYVTLYFTQSDVEYYTSDNPRIKEIEEEKAGDWIVDYIDGKGQVCVNNPKEVKRLKDLKKRTTYCLDEKNVKIDCNKLYRKFYYDSHGDVQELE